MQFSATQPALARAIAEAARGVPSKSGNSALTNLLVRADENGTVSFTGCNLGFAITSEISTSVESPGAVLVPASELSALVSRLENDGAILMGLNDKGRLVVQWGKGGKNRAEIATMDSEQFPIIPTMGNSQSRVTMSSHAFAEIVRRIAVCASRDISRPMLTGVNFRRQDDGMVVSATDGLFAALEFVPDAPDLGHKSVTIPADFLGEVVNVVKSRLSRGESDVVYIGMTESGNMVVFKCGSVEVAGTVLEGDFPPVSRVIRPIDESTGAFRVDSQTMRRALARCVALSSDVFQVSFVPSEYGVTLEALSQSGLVNEEVEITWRGEPTEVAANPKMLDAMLAALPGGEIGLGVSGPGRPISVVCDVAPNWAGTVMPMHKGGDK